MFIYKRYDRESLDVQYNTRLHVPGYADYLNRWESLSRDTEEILPVIKDLSYGNLNRERLDIYPSLLPHSKTLIFLHGGYWQMLDKSMFHFIAAAFHPYAVTTVLLTYPLAPEASMDQIVLSCRRAVKWLYSNIPAFNGDPDQMYAAGYSAGGHLAAMLMTTHWPAFHNQLPAGLLRGVCVVSGLFNLVPIQLCYINSVLKMEMETAIRNSPVRLEPSNACPLIVAVGEAESSEFKDQSEEFYSCWKNKAIDARLLQLPLQNHYSILDTTADSQSILHRAIKSLMMIE